MVAAATLFIVFAFLAGFSDARTRKISNRLNVACLLLGLSWRALSVDPLTVLSGCAGIAVGFALLVVPFSLRWMGAGDVKFLAACGAWLGPAGVLYAGLAGLILGGLIAAAIMLTSGATLRREVVATMTASLTTLTPPVAPVRSQGFVIPLGVPLGVCAVVTFVVQGLS